MICVRRLSERRPDRSYSRADPDGAAASLRDRDRSRWLTLSVSRVTEHGVVRQTERERRMVDQNRASWNRIARWLGQMEALRAAA
jgi:hypothetical protein